LPTTPQDIPSFSASADQLIAHMAHDKKVQDGKLTFILARGIGQAFVSQDVPIEAVRSALTPTPGAASSGDFLSKARHYYESAQGLRSLAAHDVNDDAKKQFLSLAESYDRLYLLMLQRHADQSARHS